MATYKFHAVQRYGKFHGTLYPASAPTPDPLKEPAQDNTGALADHLGDQISAMGLDDGDDIIWRNVAYDDFDRLINAVRLASY